MDSLKEIFAGSGLKTPQTYLNSGNVIFESDNTDQAEIEKLIKNEISTRMHLDVEVLVRSKKELSDIITADPFESPENNYVILLKLPVMSDITAEIEKVKKSDDQYQVLKNVIYLYVPGGFGRTKLNNGFFEKHLKASATTRNIKTIMKMVSLTGVK